MQVADDCGKGGRHDGAVEGREQHAQHERAEDEVQLALGHWDSEVSIHATNPLQMRRRGLTPRVGEYHPSSRRLTLNSTPEVLTSL